MNSQNNSSLPSDIQKELIEELLAIKPKEIWLFGSYAKGNPKPSSDVDLFVVKKNLKEEFHRDFVNLRNDLKKFQDKYGIDIDIFVDTKSGIKEKIAKGDSFYTSVFDGATKIYSKKRQTINTIKKQSKQKNKIGLWLKQNLFKEDGF
ncbi:nucleotidyltransferase domain-containing protein [Campylobacter sp. RM12327]|uniref:nucleotidyltransferase family protein n=1 Tax=Campylobacter sputorum TaxID=206 RepID=UPI000B78A4C7|nr:MULTISPECIES: nucleotidyltransferase domain-containing protein [Campylobacter]ASM40840.1 nucleotidyl transferase domain protein [Campylobacter sputorum]MBE7357850.1 nucleotidyltransferase domain-containing protein [Campylobacter sp. RM11302]MBF6669723.1 nucleotidyltransferase domain-containing protein [Campylobacter sp. RM12327]MBF6674866.1 nucleotidyltransferase domain-containing protein [Campylobacter sp. RM13538]MBF6675696.1 nucleotidyltransferase domain-containing protein [Campylobacter